MDLATLAPILGVGVVLLAGYLAVKVLRGSPASGDPHRARMQCAACGWTGLVSKHKSRCAQCGGTVLTPAGPAARR